MKHKVIAVRVKAAAVDLVTSPMRAELLSRCRWRRVLSAFDNILSYATMIGSLSYLAVHEPNGRNFVSIKSGDTCHVGNITEQRSCTTSQELRTHF